jgi:hypothetical protein
VDRDEELVDPGVDEAREQIALAEARRVGLHADVLHARRAPRGAHVVDEAALERESVTRRMPAIAARSSRKARSASRSAPR